MIPSPAHHLSNSISETGFYWIVKQCSASVCWIMIPQDAVAQRDVQKMRLEAFPSDATRHQSKRLRWRNMTRRLIGIRRSAAMFTWRFGWFLFGKSPPSPSPLPRENGLTMRNRCNEASEKSEHHTCVNAKKWKRMHSCVIILFISPIGRKSQLLPWKAGKSSVEKSKMTQCCWGLWSKLYRCRFQS